MAPTIPEDTIDDAVISTIMGENGKPIMTATESEGSIVSSGQGTIDPDIENIPTAGLKCDLLFNVFQNRAFEEPEFMRRLRVILQFNVLKNGKQACIWTADNKSFADVICYREPARGVKPDCIVAMDDDDIFGVMLGKINPQRLFMRGKIKVKGNVMLMQRLNTLWIEFQRLGKAPEIPLVAEILLDHALTPGLKSEFVIIELIQRIVRIPSLFHTAPGIHQITITKDGKEVAHWLISLVDKTPKILRGQDPKATSCMIIDDVDFARLVLMKMRLNEGIATGRIVVKGEKEKLLGLDKLFSTPTSVRSNL